MINPRNEAKVQIEKKQNRSTSPSATATSHGVKVAQEYAAEFTTRLALARWTRGGDIPHVHLFDHEVPMRAAWYENAQRQFQHWLEGGGFHQPSLDGTDSAIHSAPCHCAQAHDDGMGNCPVPHEGLGVRTK